MRISNTGPPYPHYKSQSPYRIILESKYAIFQHKTWPAAHNQQKKWFANVHSILIYIQTNNEWKLEKKWKWVSTGRKPYQCQNHHLSNALIIIKQHLCTKWTVSNPLPSFDKWNDEQKLVSITSLNNRWWGPRCLPQILVPEASLMPVDHYPRCLTLVIPVGICFVQVCPSMPGCLIWVRVRDWMLN